MRKIQEYVENSMDIQLIKLFVNKTEASVKNKMREKGQSAYEEIKLVVDSGMELIDGYVEACDKLKDAWQEVHELIEEDCK